MAGTSLVFQLARFGDLVQTGRLVGSLGPGTTVVVDTALVPLAQILFPAVDVVGAPIHGKGPRQWQRWQEIVACLQAMAPSRVYLLNFSGLSAALAGAFPQESLAGYGAVAGALRVPPWLGLAVRWTATRRWGGINLMDIWGLLAPQPLPPGEVHPAARPQGPRLGVAVGGQNPRRSLSAPVLAAWIPAALARSGAREVVLLGAPGQERLAAQVLAALPPVVARSTHNMVGRTGWHELVDVVRGCALVLTPDTGLAHLAARLGVPVLGAYLASAWVHETGPYGVGHYVLQSLVPCAPCLETAPCPEPGRCLHALASRETLRWIAQGDGELPDNVVAYASGVDALGGVYRPEKGYDPTEESRQAVRAQAAALWGISLNGSQAAGDWIREGDWMLPRPWGVWYE